MFVQRALGSHSFVSELAHSLMSIIMDKIWKLLGLEWTLAELLEIEKRFKQQK